MPYWSSWTRSIITLQSLKCKQHFHDAAHLGPRVLKFREVTCSSFRKVVKRQRAGREWLAMRQFPRHIELNICGCKLKFDIIVNQMFDNKSEQVAWLDNITYGNSELMDLLSEFIEAVENGSWLAIKACSIHFFAQSALQNHQRIKRLDKFKTWEDFGIDEEKFCAFTSSLNLETTLCWVESLVIGLKPCPVKLSLIVQQERISMRMVNIFIFKVQNSSSWSWPERCCLFIACNFCSVGST